MTWPRAARALVAAAALCGTARADGARAEPAPGAPSRYPFAVELKLSKGAAGSIFTFAGVVGPFAPPDPGTEIRFGAQARGAYAAFLRRRFHASEPAAVIELEKVRAELDFDDQGWHAVVEHGLVMRAAGGGAEIGRWTTRGRAPIVGLGARAMPAAFEKAAGEAASRFEAAFEEPAGVVSWLRGRGVATTAVPGGAPVADAEAASGPPAPARGVALHLDAGLGLYLFAKHGFDAASLAQQALGLRAGVSVPWGFAQLAISGTSLDATSARPGGAPYPDAREVRTLGLEAGPAWRLPNAELWAGVGLQRVRAGSSSATVGSLSAGIRSVPAVSRDGVRIRIGFEGRRELGETLVVQTGAAETVSLVPVTSLWLLLGIELPIGRR